MTQTMEKLEGHRVTVSLTNGCRLEECHLVSSGRGAVQSIWLYVDGVDVFVPRHEVADVYEWADATAA